MPSTSALLTSTRPRVSVEMTASPYILGTVSRQRGGSGTGFGADGHGRARTDGAGFAEHHDMRCRSDRAPLPRPDASRLARCVHVTADAVGQDVRMARFGDGLAVDADLSRAAEQAAGTALEQLAGRRPDLACVFVSGSDPDAVAAAGELAARTTGAAAVIGCSAPGVLA